MKRESAEEYRRLIVLLLNRIEDAGTLRIIYAWVNRIFCR